MNISLKRGLESSTVFESAENVHSIRRQSFQNWLTDGEDPLLAEIARRVAEWTQQPTANQEDLQVVRYPTGGLYQPHFDGCVGDEKNCEAMDGKSGPRLYTVLIYLNDDYVGGHTRFPWKLYSVTPKQGKAILFANVHPTSHKVAIDSLHGGDVVTAGEKWIATKWVHPRRYYGIQSAETPGANAADPAATVVENL